MEKKQKPSNPESSTLFSGSSADEPSTRPENGIESIERENPISLPRSIVPPEERSMIKSAPVPLEVAIDRAEKSIQKLKQMKILSLQMTTEKDWIDQHGNPYLMDSGAKSIKNLWGIDIHKTGEEKTFSEDEKGPYYIYTFYGYAFSRTLGSHYEDIGTCSQRDEFFGIKDGEIKKLSEIDETSVKKAAYTNLTNRLIKGILGMSNLSWDDLRAVNLNIEKITQIKYKDGAKKIERALTPESIIRKDEIKKMLAQLAGADKDAKAVFLKQASIFQIKEKDANGKETGAKKDKFVEDVDELTTDKWIAMVHSNLKKALENYTAMQHSPNGEKK